MGKFGLLHHSNSRTAAVARFPPRKTAFAIKAWGQGSGGCDLHHCAAFRVALTEAQT
jgi:hypothetical protein